MPKSVKPEKKVAVAAGGGVVALGLVWIAQLLGLDMPLPVAEGIVLAAALIAGWLAPHTRRTDLE